jgi:hypothetical protein
MTPSEQKTFHARGPRRRDGEEDKALGFTGLLRPCPARQRKPRRPLAARACSFAASIAWDGQRSRGLAGTASGIDFHDGNQKGEATDKKMLKMQVAPNMLLKTKGSKKTNCVTANMFMKTSSLPVLPISS